MARSFARRWRRLLHHGGTSSEGGSGGAGAGQSGAENAPATHAIPPPPLDLLERAKSRDGDALGAFFDHYFSMIHGLAFHLVGNRETAQDVTQEVFLRVHRAIDRIDTARDPRPWLTTITYNVCRDLWRSEKSRRTNQTSSWEDEPGLQERVAADQDSPEGAAIRNEERAIVQAALRELPEGLRTVVVLHDYQGLAHDKIAELVGASHAAVRKRYSRALKALATILPPLLEMPGERPESL